MLFKTLNFFYRKSNSLFWFLKQKLLSLIVRIQILEVGKKSKFYGNPQISNATNISIGAGVQIGNKVILNAIGKLVVEDNVMLFQDVEIISSKSIKIGKGTTLNKNVTIKGNVKIEENVWVAQNCIIEGSEVCVLKDVILGPYVHIVDGSHKIDSNKKILNDPGESSPILIGENVWVGAGAIILPGVTIGKGSIIAARSVVTKNIPDFVVAAGIPAKVIKSR